MKILVKLVSAAVLSSAAVGLMGASAPVAPKLQPKENQIVLDSTNTLVMDREFTQESVAELELKAQLMNTLLPSSEPIYLVLRTPGGSVDAGLELIDFLNSLNRPVNTITTFSASMGFQTVQGLNGQRYLLDHGILMSHKAKGGFEGEFSPYGAQVESRLALAEDEIRKMEERAVARSNGKLTIETYEKMVASEMWCAGQKCVDLGVADKVISATCDASLTGIEHLVVHFSFMGMPLLIQADRPKCPMISGLLNVKIEIEKRAVLVDSLDAMSKDPTLGILSVDQLVELQKQLNAKLDILSGNYEILLKK